MPRLLADVNVHRTVAIFELVLKSLGLWEVLADIGVELLTFDKVGLPRDLDDQSLWKRCQAEGWVLLTENRDEDGPKSLEATLKAGWKAGDLPVLTLANKRRFQVDRAYAERVGADVAELLFGIAQGEYCDRPRIYVPLSLRA
jgi:hypothetical protein